MRFRQFNPHEDESLENREKQTTGEQHPRRAALEVQDTDTASSQASTRGLPLEWRRLTPFIQAHRAVRPNADYARGFWKRLEPRLRRALRKDELVREYLQETLWRRWTWRAAAAILFAVMLWGIGSLHSQNQKMQTRMTQMEQEIHLLKAGF